MNPKKKWHLTFAATKNDETKKKKNKIIVDFKFLT